MGSYQAGAVSCASFVASFAVLAGGPWPHFTANGWAYFAGAVLGAPVAFTAAAMAHGRRGARGGTASTLASVALGWAAAVAAVIFALAGYVLFVIIRAGYLRAVRYQIMAPPAVVTRNYRPSRPAATRAARLSWRHRAIARRNYQDLLPGWPFARRRVTRGGSGARDRRQSSGARPGFRGRPAAGAGARPADAF